MLDNSKAYIITLGSILFISAFIDLGNYWEYLNYLINSVCWLVVYVLLARWHVKHSGHTNIFKWQNYLYTALISIVIAQGLLDVIYQAHALPIRIEKGEMYHGAQCWLYYSESAKAIDKLQPLYIVSYQFTLSLYSIAIFIFIFCSGIIHRDIFNKNVTN